MKNRESHKTLNKKIVLPKIKKDALTATVNQTIGSIQENFTPAKSGILAKHDSSNLRRP